MKSNRVWYGKACAFLKPVDKLKPADLSVGVVLADDSMFTPIIHYHFKCVLDKHCLWIF